MSIKFAVIRTSDGHATDPLRGNARVRAGVTGFFEVLATDKADAFRFAVDGQVLDGRNWPASPEVGKVTVVIEQLVDGQVVDTKQGEVEIIASH